MTMTFAQVEQLARALRGRTPEQLRRDRIELDAQAAAFAIATGQSYTLVYYDEIDAAAVARRTQEILGR